MLHGEEGPGQENPAPLTQTGDLPLEPRRTTAAHRRSVSVDETAMVGDSTGDHHPHHQHQQQEGSQHAHLHHSHHVTFESPFHHHQHQHHHHHLPLLPLLQHHSPRDEEEALKDSYQVLSPRYHVAKVAEDLNPEKGEEKKKKKKKKKRNENDKRTDVLIGEEELAKRREKAHRRSRSNVVDGGSVHGSAEEQKQKRRPRSMSLGDNPEAEKDENEAEAAGDSSPSNPTREEENAQKDDQQPRLLRRHTLSLSRRKEVVHNIDDNILREGVLVWRQSRKSRQHVVLSLTPTILWIRKANKNDFSPFLEVININNVYMRKGTETVFPDKPENAQELITSADSIEIMENKQENTVQDRRLSLDSPVSGDPESLGTSRKIGSMIMGWTGRRVISRDNYKSDGAGVQPKTYYSFVIEVRRKEFTTGFLTYVFMSEDKAEIEPWVCRFHDAIIAARLARAKAIKLEKQAMQEAITSSEKEIDTGEAEDNELSFQRDLYMGLTSVLPGETEKQRIKRLKRELKGELQERKRLGKAEAKLSILGLITSKGYPAEEHKVTTSDGYILTIHRIPHSKNETGFSKRPVAFLMHGLMDCSATWIANEAHKSLGFIFADAGFDVWMGNCRGNRFSREHEAYKADSVNYWRFNRDDLLKDAEDSVDYVLKKTQYSHLTYVGHSQGTNIMFGLMSSRPSIKSKINIFIALAPAVYVHNQKAKMMTYLANMQTDKLFQFMGIKAFLATGSWLSSLAPGFFISSAHGSRLIFDSMCGWNPDNNFSLERLPVIAAHQPGGTSVMVMAQWAQAIRNRKFCRYDYGSKKNEEVYGQEEPPLYDLGKIDNAQIAIFYGGEDKLTCKQDVERLIEELPQESKVYIQYEEEYGHLDFVWGEDAHIRIYAKMVLLARQYHSLFEDQLKEDDDDDKPQPDGEKDEEADDGKSNSDEKSKSKSKKKKGNKQKGNESTKSKNKEKKKPSTEQSDELLPQCTGELVMPSPEPNLTDA